MRIAVAGSRDWGDYNTLIRKVTIEIEDWALNNPQDTRLVFVHTGQAGAENMVTEYVGKTQSYMKQKGRNINDVVFYSSPDKDRDFELLSSGIDKVIVFGTNTCKRTYRFAKLAEGMGLEVSVYDLD